MADAINPRFDFSEMAKCSLGRHWAGRRPEEQREFVTSFAAIMRKAFADNTESYISDKILYTRESEDQGYTEVETEILGGKDPSAAIKYKLHSVDRVWKVYDYVIEEVSVVKFQRLQFDWAIAQWSFADLIRLLRETHSQADKHLCRLSRPFGRCFRRFRRARAPLRRHRSRNVQ